MRKRLTVADLLFFTGTLDAPFVQQILAEFAAVRAAGAAQATD
jgi:hypothetical protein